MKLYATITSERASKGQGGNEYIDIDIFNVNQEIIGRLVLQVDANNPERYILATDNSLRDWEKLRIIT